MRGRRPTICVALLFSACRPDEGGETAGPALLEMQADQVIVGMDYTITRDGLRRGRLLADTAYFFDGQSEIQLRGVNATFFDADGREISTLTSRQGVFHTETEDMEATGQVIVHDLRDNQRLETEPLNYAAAEELISTDAEFVLYQGSTTFRGTGFTSDPGMDQTIMNQPSGVSAGVRQPLASRPEPAQAGSDTADTALDSLVEDAGAPADSASVPADSGGVAAPDSLVTPQDTTSTAQVTIRLSPQTTIGGGRGSSD